MILIQGAMDIEIEYLLENLKELKEYELSSFKFYKGRINDKEVVISKTGIGTIKATIATTIGIMKFKPNAVINQGIAGAHLDTIHTGDIILGEECVNINSFNMPEKEKGQGSNPFEWEVNKRGKEIYSCDKKLLDLAKKVKYKKGKKYIGRLGSGDLFSREIDRINWIQKTFNNLCEDMESIGVYTACNSFGIPCIGIRAISNNEITKEPLSKEIAIDCQKFVLQMI